MEPGFTSIDLTKRSTSTFSLAECPTYITHHTPQLQEATPGPTDDASAADESDVHYSYREQGAYLSILYLALVVAIAFFLIRYANRSLFRWHTVRMGGVHIDPYKHVFMHLLQRLVRQLPFSGLQLEHLPLTVRPFPPQYFNIAVAYFTAVGLLLLVPLDLAVTKLTRLADTQAGYAQLEAYSNSLFACYG